MSEQKIQEDFRLVLCLLMLLLTVSLFLPIVYLPFIGGSCESEQTKTVDTDITDPAKVRESTEDNEKDGDLAKTERLQREPASEFERGGVVRNSSDSQLESSRKTVELRFPTALRRSCPQDIRQKTAFDDDLTPYSYVIETEQERKTVKRVPSKIERKSGAIYSCDGVYTNVSCGADAKPLDLRPISYVSKKWRRFWKIVHTESPGGSKGGKRVVRIKKLRSVRILRELLK